MPYARVKNELPLIPGYSEGAIAYASDAAAAPLNKCICYINPVQDLHGQDYPYPSGGSKNELPMSISEMKSLNTTGTWNGNEYTLNGITFSVLTDNGDNIIGIKVNGTATAEANFDICLYIIKAGTSKKINGTSTQSSDTTIAYGFRGYGTVPANADRTITRDASASDWDNDVYINVYQGYNAQNLMYYPMIRDASISDGTFAPYSNICPITGHTELNLVQKDGTNTVVHTYTTDLGTTVYGGTLDVETGVLTVTKGYIASYDGETLPSDWICDRAVYESGTTPPTGSQVVYTLATPTTVQLTPQEVTTLLGENSFYHDCNGDTKITFIRRLDS